MAAVFKHDEVATLIFFVLVNIDLWFARRHPSPFWHHSCFNLAVIPRGKPAFAMFRFESGFLRVPLFRTCAWLFIVNIVVTFLGTIC